MPTGVISITLTFTFVSPQNPPLFVPPPYTIDVPWVEHIHPLRASIIPTGSEASGFGYCRRKGSGEGSTALLDRGHVLCHLNGDVALKMYVDLHTAPIFILKEDFPGVDGFESCLRDLSEQINGPAGEIDVP